MSEHRADLSGHDKFRDPWIFHAGRVWTKLAAVEEKDFVNYYQKGNSEFSIFLLFPDTKICKTCDAVLAELERVNDDAERFGVRFVKNGERAVAKKLLGITQFPALAYYRWVFRTENHGF